MSQARSKKIKLPLNGGIGCEPQRCSAVSLKEISSAEKDFEDKSVWRGLRIRDEAEIGQASNRLPERF